jgi:hypothetical protein
MVAAFRHWHVAKSGCSLTERFLTEPIFRSNVLLSAAICSSDVFSRRKNSKCFPSAQMTPLEPPAHSGRAVDAAYLTHLRWPWITCHYD